MRAATKPSVLLVDDEPNVVNATRRLLGSTCECHVAHDGSGALTQIESRTFDYLITDMRMPKMSGAEFLSEAAILSPNSVRVVLSGQAAADCVAEALRYAHQYLSKPVSQQTVRALIVGIEAAKAAVGDPELVHDLVCLRTVPGSARIRSQLQEAVRSDDADLEHVAELVESCPALAVKVMQVKQAFGAASCSEWAPGQVAKQIGFELLRLLVGPGRAIWSTGDTGHGAALTAVAQAGGAELWQAIGSQVMTTRPESDGDSVANAGGTTDASDRHLAVGEFLCRLWGVDVATAHPESRATPAGPAMTPARQ